MRNQKWFIEFASNLTHFEEDYKKSQSDLTPIGYALKTHLIPESKYTAWAQKNYNLPYLDDKYFKSQLPPAHEWKNWKNEYRWSCEIVPLSVWDGHLIVACLEIPFNFPASLYPIFVLADFKNIEKTYQYYINSEKGSSLAKEKAKESQNQRPTDQSFADQNSLKKSGFDANGNLELSDAADSSEEVLSLSLNDNEDQSESPEGLDLGPIEPTTFPKIENLSNTQEKFPIPFSAPSNSENFKKNSATTSDSHEGNEDQREDSISIKTSTDHDISNNTNAFLPENVKQDLKKGMPFLISLKKENSERFESYTQDLFYKSRNVYSKMILFANDPGDNFTVPVSWTDSIIPRNKNIESILLNEPSIFKIVNSTIKSYHGYVVLNEVNEKFFDFWNDNEVPGNITMCPIILKNKVIGFLMGLGEPSSYNWGTLKNMERITQEMTEHFAFYFQNDNQTVNVKTG